MSIMNLSAYAQHKGVTVAAVKKAIESGRIKVTKKNGKYNIDSEIADKQWAANSNAAKANHIKPEIEYPEFMVSKAKEQYYKAEKARIDYEERNKELLPINEVMELHSKVARITRESMLNIADKISYIVAAETNPDVIHMIISTHIADALTELSDALS